MKVAVNTAKLLRNVPLPDEISTVHDNAVVIDMGTGLTRIGFGGEDGPRLQYPTVVGHGGGANAAAADASGTLECFGKAHKMRDTLNISRVMKRGLVTDWDGWTALMHSIYEQLNLHKDPNAPLLLTEVALAPREQREKMIEILFEEVQAQAVYFGTAPVMSLYASGRTSGLTVELGAEVCHTVPVYEGLGLFHSYLELDFGGDDLTDALMQTLFKQGAPRFPLHHEREVYQYAKEVHATVQPDSGSYVLSVAEANQGDVVHHRLPDGSTLKLGPERYRIAEGLFDPALIKREGQRGIHQLAVESVNKCDVDIAPLLLGNVVLSGGTSLLKGLPARINRELQDLAVAGADKLRVSGDKIRVYAATERRHAAWVGGSILASLPTFQDFWITKADYDEAGKAGPEARRALGHKNCF